VATTRDVKSRQVLECVEKAFFTVVAATQMNAELQVISARMRRLGGEALQAWEVFRVLNSFQKHAPKELSDLCFERVTDLPLWEAIACHEVP
jgi:hypothetical protein